MSPDQIAPEDEMALAETLPQADASSLVDREVPEAQVKDMYRQVAREEEAELNSTSRSGAGAIPRRSYVDTLEAAGFRVEEVRTNDTTSSLTGSSTPVAPTASRAFRWVL